MPPGPVPGGFLTRRLPPWFPMNWAHCAADEPKVAIINGFWNFNTKRGDWIFPPNHPSNCTMIAFQARTGSKHARRTIVPITAKTRSCKRSAPPLPRPRPARRRTRPHRAARKQGLPRQRKNGPPVPQSTVRLPPPGKPPQQSQRTLPKKPPVLSPMGGKMGMLFFRVASAPFFPSIADHDMAGCSAVW